MATSWQPVATVSLRSLSNGPRGTKAGAERPSAECGRRAEKARSEGSRPEGRGDRCSHSERGTRRPAFQQRVGDRVVVRVVEEAGGVPGGQLDRTGFGGGQGVLIRQDFLLELLVVTPQFLLRPHDPVIVDGRV